MTHHPELALEQAYLDRAYAHLARMRERTEAGGRRSRSPRRRRSTRPSPRPTCTPGSARLDTDVDGLTFGRLDAEDGDTWYVGRRHVEDERGRSRGRRLAGARVHALLPGHRRRPDGAAAGGAAS